MSTLEGTIDLRSLEQRLRHQAYHGHLGQLELELREAAVELAAVSNVLTLSPRQRIERGAEIHRRIQARLATLDARLTQLESDQLRAVA